MKYHDYLKQLGDICPFCTIEDREIVTSNHQAHAILARAPYCEDHFLIITKKHHIKASGVSAKERDAVHKLVTKITRLLHQKGHHNVALLLRDGLVQWGNANKSVDHFHYHIIPDRCIGDMEMIKDKRIIRDNKTYKQKTQTRKKRMEMMQAKK